LKKKKSRRSSCEFPGLNPKLNLKTRQDEIEDLASYADQLSLKDKRWLNAFSEEEINANFNHKGPKLNKSKANKKRIYNKNNARNRDILTRVQAQGKSIYLKDAFNSEEEMHEKLQEMYDASNPESED